MCIAIIEIVLSQPNANWQDGITIDAIAPEP
jgi:hypothetical protein